MPYFDRLLTESGVGFNAGQPTPSPSSPAPAEAEPAGGLELERVVEVSQPDSLPSLMRKAATSDPASTFLPSSASSSLPGTGPALAPAAISAGPESTRRESRAPMAEAAVSPPVPHTPVLPPGLVTETYVVERTPEERILETIAAVRAWTSEPVMSRQPSAHALEPAEPVEATAFEPPFMTVQRPILPGTLVPRISEPLESARARRRIEEETEGPDVVSVSLSIGSIELTVDASDGTIPASNREPPPLQHVAEPDTAARLRRHFYRDPIGW